MIDWISIDDFGSPEIGRPVLLRNDHTKIVMAVIWGGSCSSDWTHWVYDNPPVKRRWMPKCDEAQGEKFFFIGDTVYESVWSGGKMDQSIRRWLGVYKTEQEAIAMRDKIRAFVEKEIGSV